MSVPLCLPESGSAQWVPDEALQACRGGLPVVAAVLHRARQHPAVLRWEEAVHRPRGPRGERRETRWPCWCWCCCFSVVLVVVVVVVVVVGGGGGVVVVVGVGGGGGGGAGGGLDRPGVRQEEGDHPEFQADVADQSLNERRRPKSSSTNTKHVVLI